MLTTTKISDFMNDHIKELDLEYAKFFHDISLSPRQIVIAMQMIENAHSVSVALEEALKEIP